MNLRAHCPYIGVRGLPVCSRNYLRHTFIPTNVQNLGVNAAGFLFLHQKSTLQPGQSRH